MPVDNTIYDRPGDPWWSDDGPLSAIRTALNPGRMEYFGRVFADLSIDPGDQTLLDIGCGGGLLASPAWIPLTHRGPWPATTLKAKGWRSNTVVDELHATESPRLAPVHQAV